MKRITVLLAEDHQIVREGFRSLLKHERESISKRVKDRSQNSVDREGNFKKKNNRLSSREVEVLQPIAEGKPNKQVATELGVSFKTQA